MDALREYILSVVAAAILCSLVTALSGKNAAAGKVLKLVCGLFLTFTLIRPIAKIELTDFTRITNSLEADAALAVGAGEDYYEESLAAVIQARTQSYILDKAQTLGAELQVQVHLNEHHIPDEVVLTGSVSPYTKGKLQSILVSELGIAKERQIWIGS